ncbi:hypothetical protein CC78DRAFT_620447 [Lojkania enalia]|uniref:Protection of telomeres protein 1 n=1 Tax=Lojkania enalia TaxID=147567 RepID=A0A9P4K2A5_9PLEO|nr:hypothetical protein CC78DRAFT_620447 [Didymosphaeria enalia]
MFTLHTMALSSGFSPIKSLQEGKSQNFIGVVVNLKAPFQSRGTDWCLEFTLKDEFDSVLDESGSCIVCRIFRKDYSALPDISDIGDIALFKKAKTSVWNGKMTAISSFATQILTFKWDDVPTSRASTPLQLDAASHLAWSKLDKQDQFAIISIKENAAPSFKQIGRSAIQKDCQPSSTSRLALVQDLNLNFFHDIRGEAVKLYSVDYNTTDLYLTDYTTNPDLFLYEDPEDCDDSEFGQTSKWQGPYGQMILPIRLYGINAQWANDNVEEGDFVFARNVHIKLSKTNKMEGAIHEDQRNKYRNDIRRLENKSDIAEIRKRKAKYEARRPSRTTTYNGPKKPSAKAAAKKREEKREMQRIQKELEQKELEEKFVEQAATRAGVNPYVRARNPDIQLSTITEIIDNRALSCRNPQKVDIVLPFVNAKYRSRVRVVDFSPSNLEDFTRSTADSTWNTSMKDIRPRWEWAFVLLVEDANAPSTTDAPRLPLFLNNDNATHLLKMTAVDLREDLVRRENLEEKLFVLWGNLLELKMELRASKITFPLPSRDERLKNMPFECCIEEYGVRIPTSPRWPNGWQRTHAMWGTTITE